MEHASAQSVLVCRDVEMDGRKFVARVEAPPPSSSSAHHSVHSISIISASNCSITFSLSRCGNQGENRSIGGNSGSAPVEERSSADSVVDVYCHCHLNGEKLCHRGLNGRAVHQNTKLQDKEDQGWRLAVFDKR